MGRRGGNGQASEGTLSASDLVIETPNVTAEETAAIFAVLHAAVHNGTGQALDGPQQNDWSRSLGLIRSSMTTSRPSWKNFSN